MTAAMKLKDTCSLKAILNIDSTLKIKDITFLTKVCLVKAMVFLVVMYRCESWTTKKAECWRTDARTAVLEKTLESPLDCKIKPVTPTGNQSWVFIQRNDAEAEAPILWPTWCEELTHWKRRWCWERLRAGGEGGDRGWDGWMASPTRWVWIWANSGRQWRTGNSRVLSSSRGCKERNMT